MGRGRFPIQWEVPHRRPPVAGASWKRGGKILPSGEIVPCGGGWVLRGALVDAAPTGPRHRVAPSPEVVTGEQASTAYVGRGAWPEPTAPSREDWIASRWTRLVLAPARRAARRQRAAAVLDQSVGLNWSPGFGLVPLASGRSTSVCSLRTGAGRFLRACGTRVIVPFCRAAFSALRRPAVRQALLVYFGSPYIGTLALKFVETISPEE